MTIPCIAAKCNFLKIFVINLNAILKLVFRSTPFQKLPFTDTKTSNRKKAKKSNRGAVLPILALYLKICSKVSALQPWKLIDLPPNKQTKCHLQFLIFYEEQTFAPITYFSLRLYLC